MKISANKAGMVLAALLGGWHLLWVCLVAVHWAQPVVDFVFWIHFIKPVYVIEDFSFWRAAMLIVLTSAVGYAGGICAGWVWNALQRLPHGDQR